MRIKLKLPALHWQILISILAGLFFGIVFPETVPYFSWMGTIFLRLLKMIMIPLVIFSLLSGITGIKKEVNIGRLGIKTISYYILTSAVAIFTGQLFVNIIEPGVGADLGLKVPVNELGLEAPAVKDILIRMIPDNIFNALTSADMLAIIVFTIIIGIFTNRMDEKYRVSLSGAYESLFELFMKITQFIIYLAPWGILGIIGGVAASQSDLPSLLVSMKNYMLTVLLALGFHAFITLPLITLIIGKANPLKHFKNMGSALVTAFSTSSSSATLPLTLESVERRSGVSNSISSFTLPLGATINMDGTALYELVAVIFIAQAYGIDLTIGTQLIIALTALLASIGAAGIPMAGMVMMSVVLSAAGLPLEGIGLILSVDKILDMFRTSVNVWSDSCGAVVIAKSEGEQLKV